MNEKQLEKDRMSEAVEERVKLEQAENERRVREDKIDTQVRTTLFEQQRSNRSNNPNSNK